MRLCAKFLRGIAIFCAPVCIMACSHDGDDSSSVLPVTAHDAAETASVADGEKSPTLVKTVRFEEDEGFMPSNLFAHYELPKENPVWFINSGKIAETSNSIDGQSLMLRKNKGEMFAKASFDIQDLVYIEFLARRGFQSHVTKGKREETTVTLKISCMADDGEIFVSEELVLEDDVMPAYITFPSVDTVTLLFEADAVCIDANGERSDAINSDAIIDNISFYALR